MSSNIKITPPVAITDKQIINMLIIKLTIESLV
jgi:hypothetical protein